VASIPPTYRATTPIRRYWTIIVTQRECLFVSATLRSDISETKGASINDMPNTVSFIYMYADDTKSEDKLQKQKIARNCKLILTVYSSGLINGS